MLRLQQLAERATPPPWLGLFVVVPDREDPEAADIPEQIFIEGPDYENDGGSPLIEIDELLAIEARNALPFLLEIYEATKHLFEDDYDTAGQMAAHTRVREALDAFEDHATGGQGHSN